MKSRTAILFSFFVMFIFLMGCGTESSGKVKTVPKQKTIESTLVKEISEGKLVEVYDEYLRLGYGETGENWMIIQNVKDAGDTFTIQPCSGCQFDSTLIDISLGKHSIVKFAVSAEAGEKEIRVKDSHNNAYGFAKFNVILE